MTQALDVKIVKIQNHRLWRYVCDSLGYNKKQVAKESGISEQTFFHWCNPKGMGQPRDESLKKMQAWLQVPWEDLMEYLGDKEKHPMHLCAKMGTATDEEIKVNRDVDWRDHIDEFERLDSLEISRLNQYLNRLLEERLASSDKNEEELQPEEKTVELNETERRRLKILMDRTIELKEKKLDEFQRDCGNSAIVQWILEEDPDYKYPRSDLEELLPNLLKITGFKGDTPQGILNNLGEQFKSVEELKEVLSNDLQ